MILGDTQTFGPIRCRKTFLWLPQDCTDATCRWLEWVYVEEQAHLACVFFARGDEYIANYEGSNLIYEWKALRYHAIKPANKTTIFIKDYENHTA